MRAGHDFFCPSASVRRDARAFVKVHLAWTSARVSRACGLAQRFKIELLGSHVSPLGRDGVFTQSGSSWQRHSSVLVNIQMDSAHSAIAVLLLY
jgi:hypothetical protein